jgi:rhodanese-related sulfurtransferase
VARGVREVATLAGCAVFLAVAIFSQARLTAVPPVNTAVPEAIPEGVHWIDARSEEEYARDHIPGALCLNEQNWEEVLPQLFETWQPPTQIVVYCDAGCPASAKIAGKLEELGIEPVKIMEGGFEAWKRSNK